MSEPSVIALDPNGTVKLSIEIHNDKLVLVTGGVEHPLHLGRNTIGRLPTNEIVVSAGTVSRTHTAIELTKETYIVYDLGSSNGTTEVK